MSFDLLTPSGGHIDIHSIGTILSLLILSTLGRDEKTPRSRGFYMSRGKHECCLRLSFFVFLTTKSVESVVLPSPCFFVAFAIFYFFDWNSCSCRVLLFFSLFPLQRRHRYIQTDRPQTNITWQIDIYDRHY